MSAKDMLPDLRAIETSTDTHLSTLMTLANLMDEPSGVVIIYQAADDLGKNLERVRGLIAKAEGAA